MNYTALLRSALVALLRNKMRSILTVLGITIGIAAVICVVAIGKAGQARVEQQLNNLGDNFVWIEAGGRAVNGVRTGTHGTKTLVLADVGRKAIAQVKQAASELLERRLPADQARALAEKLTAGTWTHDYPIWASTAKSLGLPVSTDMPNGVLELMKLYPQPVRMQSGGGVEYLPVPRQKEVAREA